MRREPFFGIVSWSARWIENDPFQLIFQANADTRGTMGKAWQETTEPVILPLISPPKAGAWDTDRTKRIPLPSSFCADHGIRPGDIVKVLETRRNKFEVIELPESLAERPHFKDLIKIRPWQAIPIDRVNRKRYENEAKMIFLLQALAPPAIGDTHLVVGEPGAGKTFLLRSIAIAAAALNLPILWICYGERDYESDQIRDLSNVTLLHIPASDPDKAEKIPLALSVAARWIESGKIFLLIVDSMGRMIQAFDQSKYITDTALSTGGIHVETKQRWAPIMAALPGEYHEQTSDGQSHRVGGCLAYLSFLQEEGNKATEVLLQVLEASDTGRILLDRRAASLNVRGISPLSFTRAENLYDVREGRRVLAYGPEQREKAGKLKQRCVEGATDFRGKVDQTEAIKKLLELAEASGWSLKRILEILDGNGSKLIEGEIARLLELIAKGKSVDILDSKLLADLWLVATNKLAIVDSEQLRGLIGVRQELIEADDQAKKRRQREEKRPSICRSCRVNPSEEGLNGLCPSCNEREKKKVEQKIQTLPNRTAQAEEFIESMAGGGGNKKNKKKKKKP